MTADSMDFMQGAYLRDLLDQGRALRETVAALQPVAQLDTLREDLRAGRRRRIVLTGMGASYHILIPLHVQLIASGFDSILVETSELVYAMPSLLARENVVIAVSQSGASAETVRMLQHDGPLYVAVSNTAGSPIAAGAGITLLTSAGPETGVSCKTALAAMAALDWLGAHLASKDLGVVRREIEALAPAVENYCSRWESHVLQLAQMLEGVAHLFIVGRGRSLGAAGMGAMIQKEAAHFQAEGMSSAAFRHGPFEMLGTDCYVVVLEGDAPVAALNRGLLRDVLATGARGALCGYGEGSAGPFLLPAVPETVRPTLEILAPQMLSLALAYMRHREPGKFDRITKVTTIE